MKRITNISLLLLLAVAAQAQNQLGSGTQTTKLSLSNSIELSFTSTGTNVGNDVNLAFNNVNDYANGIESNAVELKVRSNKRFFVNTRSTSDNFTYTGNTTPAPVMPVLDVLFIKVIANNTGGFVPANVDNVYRTLRNSTRRVISNGQRGGNQTFSVKYKAVPGFAYPAGTYTVDVLFTATQK